MYPGDTNEHGCPLREQRGVDAVQGFDTIIAALPPDLHAAFLAEHDTRQQELDEYVVEHGYRT
jgi:hypothetical protein